MGYSSRYWGVKRWKDEGLKKNSKMKNEDVKGRYLPQTKAKAKLDYASHGTNIFRIGQY